jgi:hypothetical protein
VAQSGTIYLLDGNMLLKVSHNLPHNQVQEHLPVVAVIGGD